jgi:hypothetical protein
VDEHFYSVHRCEQVLDTIWTFVVIVEIDRQILRHITLSLFYHS